jgi:2-methylisocitrate lyase-like PEP mutase family enzyme
MQTTRVARQVVEGLPALHVPGDPLVLPNAWDAASARMVEAAGFPLVATSNFATATILGYTDGEQAPGAVARIARTVEVRVTVDFERGRAAPARRAGSEVSVVGRHA